VLHKLAPVLDVIFSYVDKRGLFCVAGFWPLVPSDRPIGDVPAMPSWQQAYMVDSQASLPGFSGSPFGLSLQPSLLENRSLAPIRQVNFF